MQRRMVGINLAIKEAHGIGLSNIRNAAENVNTVRNTASDFEKLFEKLQAENWRKKFGIAIM